MKTLESKRYIVEEKTGYMPMVGRLLSMMEYTRLTTLEAVNNLTQEQLDYRIDGKGNSIGALLYHMACLEEIYVITSLEDRDPNEEEVQRLTVGLELGEKAHEEVHGKEIEFYKQQLDVVRKRTLELFKGIEDTWLDKVRPLGPEYLANNYFKWFHVFEDELNHRGQINLIRSHMKRK